MSQQGPASSCSGRPSNRWWARPSPFVIDAFARRLVGWRASSSLQAGFVLDALDQALYDRRPLHGHGLIHHSDRGVQYVSIKYTERLAEAGIEPSVGGIGDSYDNALAESVIGLFKTEVIRHKGPWRGLQAVAFATLEWVDWFNNRRLLEPIGNIPPAEAEARYYTENREIAMFSQPSYRRLAPAQHPGDGRWCHTARRRSSKNTDQGTQVTAAAWIDTAETADTKVSWTAWAASPTPSSWSGCGAR